MEQLQSKRYVFNTPAQWRSGASRNFEVNGFGLSAAPVWTFSPLLATEAKGLLAFDVCGRLQWLAQTSGELFRQYPFGAQSVGFLLDAEFATQFAAGATRFWVSTEHSLMRYAEHSLSLLEHRSVYGLRAMGTDHGDGVWMMRSGKDQKQWLHRLDKYGGDMIEPIGLSLSINQAVLAAGTGNQTVAILDFGRAAPHTWRLVLVNIETGRWREFSKLGGLDPSFQPTLAAVDHQNRIILADRQNGAIWCVGFSGEILSQHYNLIPPQYLPLNSIAARESICISGPQGIASVQPALESESVKQESTSMYITPTLVSPPGNPSGWSRAEIDAVLPQGTTLQISYAASDDTTLAANINAILADGETSSAVKVEMLREALSWRVDESVIFSAGDNEQTRLRYLLHQANGVYLWLWMTCYSPPGRGAPKINTLQVLYPRSSYLNYLPAIYREEPNSAQELHRALAPFQVEFDDQDGVIDRLPANIDPKTAPDSWLPLLLRWLGLPPPQILDRDVQRELLNNAPELLSLRGTLRGLELVLTILTQDAAHSITDFAAGPTPWILTNGDNNYLPRLGLDTLLMGQKPSPFCLGKTSFVNQIPLGSGHVDKVKTFNGRVGEIFVRVAAAESERPDLKTIIEHYVPYFLPAHCRLKLEFAAPGWRVKGRILNQNLTLADAKRAELGAQTVLGSFCLPVGAFDQSILDRTSYLDKGLRLG